MKNMHTTNKFDALCSVCGDVVRAGSGQLFAKRVRVIGFSQKTHPQWSVKHKNLDDCRKENKNEK